MTAFLTLSFFVAGCLHRHIMVWQHIVPNDAASRLLHPKCRIVDMARWASGKCAHLNVWCVCRIGCCPVQWQVATKMRAPLQHDWEWVQAACMHVPQQVWWQNPMVYGIRVMWWWCATFRAVCPFPPMFHAMRWRKHRHRWCCICHLQMQLVLHDDWCHARNFRTFPQDKLPWILFHILQRYCKNKTANTMMLSRLLFCFWLGKKSIQFTAQNLQHPIKITYISSQTIFSYPMLV